MPYQVSFSRRVGIVDRERYINDCCIGGDAVVDHLLPSVRARYTDIQTNQEDLGLVHLVPEGQGRTRHRRVH
jgi:hypothetical protein